MLILLQDQDFLWTDGLSHFVVNSGTRLVAHDPGGVDEAPVGGPRDPIVGPPLLPVGRDHAHQAQQREHPRDHVSHPCFFRLAFSMQILSAIQCHEGQLVFLSAKIHYELKRLYLHICQERPCFKFFSPFLLMSPLPLIFLGLLIQTQVATLVVFAKNCEVSYTSNPRPPIEDTKCCRLRTVIRIINDVVVFFVDDLVQEWKDSFKNLIL